MRILDFPAFNQGSGNADSPRVPGRERDPWARPLVRSAPRGRVPLTLSPGPGPHGWGWGESRLPLPHIPTSQTISTRKRGFFAP